MRTGGASNNILVQWLSIHSVLSSKILQLKSCTRSLLQLTPQTPSTNSLPNEILWSAFTWMNTSLKMRSLSSLQWAFLSRLPRYFGSVVINWAICSNSTFLGNHDPKYREVSTCNNWKWFEDVATCQFSLHPVSSTNLTSKHFFNSSPTFVVSSFIYL